MSNGLGMRARSVGVTVLLLTSLAAVGPARATSPDTSIIVSGTGGTAAALHLSRPVALGDEPFVTPRLAGPDGTFVALVVRDTKRNIVFSRLLGRGPTFRRVEFLDYPQRGAQLLAGDYTVELLGRGAQTVTVRADGLPRSVRLRTTTSAGDRLQVLHYSASATATASVDRITLPTHASLVFQLQGTKDTANPHVSGAALCSATATKCYQADAFGSRNEMSGPTVLGVPVVTDGSSFTYYTYLAQSLPPGELVSEQNTVTPLQTWRAVLVIAGDGKAVTR